MILEKARFVLGQIAHGMIRPQKEINEAVDTVFSELDKRIWIPVSEKMPEEGVDVLCSIHFKRMDLAPNAVEWFVDICHYRDNDWYTYFDDDAIGEVWHDVVAWMPLPQCYQENQL